MNVLVDDNNAGTRICQIGPGIDNKLGQKTGSTSSYFSQDHLGSNVGLTNSSGASIGGSSYDSFGNGVGFSSPYQFTGREFDGGTGLQYSRARWYDPNIGRFISEDPIGFGGGDVNLYGYARNNPIYIKDPLGTTATGNLQLLFDFVTGLGDSNRTYQLGSPEQQEMSSSPGVGQLREDFIHTTVRTATSNTRLFKPQRIHSQTPIIGLTPLFRLGDFKVRHIE